MNFVVSANVEKIVKHNSNLKEYLMKLEKNRKYPPGSFVQLTLEDVTASDRWPESRTFSVASYKKGYMRFIIKREGEYTSKILDSLEENDKVTIKYPFGELYDETLDQTQHVFIAGGVGITPFLGLIEYYDSLGLNNIELHYSVKAYKDLIHLDYIRSKIDNLHIYITQEKSKDFINRRIDIEDLIKNEDDNNRHYYVCGSKDFNRDFNRMLQENGIKNIHMDEWE